MTAIKTNVRPFVVLAGTSPYARLMVEVYRRVFGHHRIVVIEERASSSRRILTFLSRRLRLRGVLSTIDALAMRLLQLFLPMPAVTRATRPHHIVNSVNDHEVARLVRAIAPEAVLLSVCSLLQREQIERIGVPIYNVHNGVTPRYRGSGNVFAMAEDNFGRIGVTVHSVDAGIDTGERISVATFDPVAEGIPFERVDEVAFARGAEQAALFLQERAKIVPAELERLNNAFYPYPGLTDWLRGRRHFRRRQRAAAGPAIEQEWKRSFSERASSGKTPLHERMHWADGNSLAWRDNLAVASLDDLPAGSRVLDLGCGDARLAARLPRFDYIGCDACLPFLQQADGIRRVVAEAGRLPFADASFDAVLAIGLFQHLAEAQLVADEIRRVLKPGGRVVLNTLRQFSKAELAVIWLMSLHDPVRRRLAAAIWRRDFGVHATPDGAVGRRYEPGEVTRLFGLRAPAAKIVYHGAGGQPVMAREITLSLATPVLRRSGSSR